jgi:hypothetical protein
MVDRICPWSRYVTQCETTKLYQTVFYNPPEAEVLNYFISFSLKLKNN